ncbi:hypothetical protein [Azotobacter chroococcum]|uniref:hypothetical protein n=1 Tax=Azotobacter chroococcum TaxID=353 RepID=UPI0010ADFD60|nr:hypothetical protein [Azotobacter chroococcum]TKD44169.1 hypothetical protein FCG41_07175 [Azotobacter chroococcum]
MQIFSAIAPPTTDKELFMSDTSIIKPRIIIKEYDLSSVILNSHLDLPKPGEALNNQQKNIKIAGWVLSKDPKKELHIVIKQNSIEQEYNLNTLRPDVLDCLASGLGKGTPREKCGFHFECQVSDELEIYFKIENTLYLWRHIRITSNTDRKTENIILAWQSFITNDLDKISEELCASLKEADSETIANLLIGSPKILFTPEAAHTITSLSESEKAYFSDFISDTKKDNFCLQLVRSAKTLNTIQLPHPFKAGLSSSRESYHYINGRTLIRFTTDDNEIFFLVQHVSSADAIYFPNRKILVLDRHLHYNDVAQQIQAICKNFDRVLIQAKNQKNNIFGGIIASHGRPYHFYYDVAPAVQSLKINGLLDEIPQIIMYSGGDFISFKDIYKLSSNELTLSIKDIEQSTQKNNTFYIHTGVRYESNDIDKELTDGFDFAIRNYSVKNTTEYAKGIISEARKCFPLIWFGVTGQKRAWSEQIETCVQIIKEIGDIFPGLGVVLDGWTSAAKPTSLDVNETINDTKVADCIREQLPHSVPIYSVIGQTSQTKIAIANMIDLFVANHATGSIHVAKFAKKPGVSHLNKEMNKQAFSHYKTKEVPASDVQDIAPENNTRPDYISYSIKPESIIKLIRQILDEENWNSRRTESKINID